MTNLKFIKKDNLYFISKNNNKSVALTKKQKELIEKATNFNIYKNGTVVIYRGSTPKTIAKGITKKELDKIKREEARNKKDALRKFTLKGGKVVFRDRYGRIRGDKLEDFSKVTFFKAKGHFLNSELPPGIISAPTAFYSTSFLNKALWKGVVSEEELVRQLNDALNILSEPGKSSDFRKVYHRWEYRYQVGIVRDRAIIGTEVDIFRGN